MQFYVACGAKECALQLGVTQPQNANVASTRSVLRRIPRMFAQYANLEMSGEGLVYEFGGLRVLSRLQLCSVSAPHVYIVNIMQNLNIRFRYVVTELNKSL
jgi:hypothetical protein